MKSQIKSPIDDLNLYKIVCTFGNAYELLIRKYKRLLECKKKKWHI